MRAGLSTIQQTLTPEAATVLNHSIAEASRRNHGQTTPLHVAATLLSSPSGFLRQACIKSHPNSSHPLQCRALELCFSVALERLPTSQNLSPGLDPPISNALMAALKRAQAHQRRGCPEQQQQPLLAVKVELEQLIISILDDPSVSRVMREASFSSPAVKATIEQSLNSLNPSNSTSVGLGFRAAGNRSNLYVNPRLQQGGTVIQSGQSRNEEVKRVVDILLRLKKRNPVLVGETEPEMVVKELFRRVESKEIDDGALKNVQVIHLWKEFVDKSRIPAKIVDVGGLIETRIRNLDSGGGVILDLGDLKWLVEQPVGYGGQQQQIVSESARSAVVEMRKLLERFENLSSSGGAGRVWLIGTATCETYLRCQVYHPSMESDWDLQAVSIAARALCPGMFPRMGTNGILSSSVESLSPLKAFPSMTTPLRRFSENFDPTQRMKCCPQCTQNYEQELAKVVPKESDRSSSEVKSEAAPLPQWLRNAKSQGSDAKASETTVNKDQELLLKQKSVELQKKWYDMCLRLHPGHHQIKDGSERNAQPTLLLTSLHNPSLIPRQTHQPQLGLNRGPIPLNPKLVASQAPSQTRSPPGSPLRTDLVLGRPKVMEPTLENVEKDPTKNLFELVPSEPQAKLLQIQPDKILSKLDVDSFKKLLKGLSEKVAWQHEAASAVASTVTQCKIGNGKRRGAASKGDIWLLFSGPDRVGKRKMALALADLVCRSSPIVVPLGSRCDDRDSDQNFRGKTVIDRVAESIRRNPSSVVILDDIDEADLLVRGSIKRAMERGRLADSHGREISLGNTIFILTADCLPDNLKFLTKGISLDEKRLENLASGSWQLRLLLCEKTAKRRAEWLQDENRPTKSRIDSGTGLSFDLNEVADAEDEKADGSHNSSDLTVDHEDEHVHNNRLLAPATSPIPSELVNSVDDHIVFKPVDFGPIRRDISNSITEKYSSIMGDKVPITINNEALDKIVGGVWLGRTSLEEWSEKVLVPSLQQLKMRLPSSTNESVIIQLEADNESVCQRSGGSLLPTSIDVVVDGL